MYDFEKLFAQYNCNLDDAQIKAQVDKILAEHFEENNNAEVWKQCLHQIDLTTLNGDDTEAKVRTMAQHVNDFPKHYPDIPNVAAICVYPALVETVKKNLTTPVGIAACCAGFPASQTFIEVKIAETALAVREGATEIDVVISIGKMLEGKYQEVYDELCEIRAAARNAHLKVILETGALKSASLIKKASIIAMQAGADFIKTSTGKIPVAATLEAALVMCQAIKEWREQTGIKVSFKPAGGIATTEDAVRYYTIVKEVLGKEWLNNENFRFGASRMANNLLSSIVGEETKWF